MEHTKGLLVAFSTDKRLDTVRSVDTGKTVCQLHDGGLNYDNQEPNARRLCAAWNYCEGIPTEELESKGAESGFWGRACARLIGEKEKLQAENAALRAAVLEMKRYLPVLEDLENDGIWDFATAGHGVATLNAYLQTLETALAKMNEK